MTADAKTRRREDPIRPILARNETKANVTVNWVKLVETEGNQDPIFNNPKTIAVATNLTASPPMPEARINSIVRMEILTIVSRSLHHLILGDFVS